MNEPRDYAEIITEAQGMLRLAYQCIIQGRKKEAAGLARRLQASMKELKSYLKTEK